MVRPPLTPEAARPRAVERREHERGTVDHRRVDDLPSAGASALDQRARDPEREQHPAAGEVAEHVDRRRRLLAGAAQRLERARQRDVVDVVAGGLRVRPVLTPAGQPPVHELRVAGARDVGPDAEPLGDAGPEHLEEGVGLLHQPQQRLDAVGLLQIDGDGLLAAVHGAGRRLRVVDGPGGVDPVDPQHLGPHVGEQHPAERPGPQPDHLHGTQPLERTRH